MVSDLARLPGRLPPANRATSTTPALLLACVLALVGCGQMAIDGEIIDVSGAPLVGAQVNLIGSTCNTQVGEDGHFALPCTPGSYIVVINKPGYIEFKVDLEATEPERYDIGKQTLVAIPESKGLFLFEDNQYKTMEAAYLTRTITNGAQKSRRYCLDREGSTATLLPPGQHTLFDNESPGWRPFLLDADGCAYRDQRNDKARWEVVCKEKPAYEERTLEREKKVAVIDLPAGDYFIANWDQGFFTTDPADKHRYLGFWLHVSD